VADDEAEEGEDGGDSHLQDGGGGAGGAAPQHRVAVKPRLEGLRAARPVGRGHTTAIRDRNEKKEV